MSKYPYSTSQFIYQFRDVPIIGQWIGKVGHIMNIMATPCDPDPEIWVEAFFSAVPHVLWSIYKPSPFDERFTRFGRAHGGRSGRKMKVLEQLLPDNEVPKGKVGTALFKGFEAAQKLGWYMTIADATLDGLIHWTSAAYTWSGCRVPGEASARASFEGNGFQGIPGHYWTIWSTDWMSGGATAYNQGVATPQNVTPTVYHNIQVQPAKPPYPPGKRFSFQLVNVTTGEAFEPFHYDPEPGALNWYTTMHRNWAANQPAQEWRILTLDCDGYFYVTGTLGVNGYKDLGLLADP